MELIVALDIEDKKKILDLLNDFESSNVWIKVGMESFFLHGPELVKHINKKGFNIFLDLKLHDIPNTVYQSIKALKHLPIQMINIHAAGGLEMMSKAKEARDEYLPNTQLIAVTQLTSTSEEQMRAEQNIQSSLLDSVLHYANLAHKAGLDGVVCSPFEVSSIKDKIDKNFITVTPGIRLNENDQNDQKRFCTPERARSFGANYIVVGRPITQSLNPRETLNHIIKRINS